MDFLIFRKIVWSKFAAPEPLLDCSPLDDDRCRHGHMCFCEEDECNAGPSWARVSQRSVLVLSVMTLLLLRWWTSLPPDSGTAVLDDGSSFYHQIIFNLTLWYFILLVQFSCTELLYICYNKSILPAQHHFPIMWYRGILHV